jgi:hypothetical protein
VRRIQGSQSLQQRPQGAYRGLSADELARDVRFASVLAAYALSEAFAPETSATTAIKIAIIFISIPLLNILI